MDGQCPSCGGSLPEDALNCPQCDADVGWHIRKPDGQVYGPMNRATLERCIAEARLVAGDEIRLGPAGEFVSAQERLGDRLRKPPPPVPPTQVPATVAAGAAAAGGASLARGCGIAVAICVGLGLIIVLISIPVVRGARTRSSQATCQSNLKQISVGLLMYAQDYDEKLPHTADWQTVTDPYIKNRLLFECPSYPTEPGYAHNTRLHGFELKKIDRPAETVMYWDAGAQVPGLTATPGATPERHNHGDNFAYTDSHVGWLPTPSVARARVNPTSAPVPAGASPAVAPPATPP